MTQPDLNKTTVSDDSCKLDELIAALEEVDQYSGELDARIDCLVKFPHLRPARPDDYGGIYGYVPGNIKSEHGFLSASPYTSSIDAALKLVPDKYKPAIHPYESANYPSRWDVYMMESGTIHHRQYDSEHKSLAIAICIAALKARRASVPSDITPN